MKTEAKWLRYPEDEEKRRLILLEAEKLSLAKNEFVTYNDYCLMVQAVIEKEEDRC